MRTIPACAGMSISNAVQDSLEQKNEYLIETEYICLNRPGCTDTHPVHCYELKGITCVEFKFYKRNISFHMLTVRIFCKS